MPVMFYFLQFLILHRIIRIQLLEFKFIIKNTQEYSMGNGVIFLGINRTGWDIDLSPLSSAEGKSK